MKRIFAILLLPLLLLAAGCFKRTEHEGEKRILRTSINKILTTLDPARAADTVCQYMVASFYDTPLQYSYRKRPYELEPSMLRRMPEISENSTRFLCELRDDLYFQEAPCFPGRGREERKITSRDVVFSILRLADARVKSSGYWLIRGKIRGIEAFRKRTERAEEGDMSPYDAGCEGLRILSDTRFEILLNAPDPRFLYTMAMPYFSVLSRRAVEYWGEKFADHPAGSGPFVLTSWKKDYQIRMRRNPEYREEFFPDAEEMADRNRPLPLADEIVCSFVKQPLAGWLLFLQGNLDYYVLDGENFAAVVNERLELAPSLIRRGIVLERTPEFQTNYIGFNFTDPLLGRNAELRRAISLAFNRRKRLEYFRGRIELANGPVPPGASGHLEKPGRYGVFDLERARTHLAAAGFPGGIDPSTGKALVLTFDQAGSDTIYRQMAELLALDLREIGILLKPEFNNRARFLQKLAQGQTQLFRLSWTGDYPDGENFFQLFYGPNAGSSNRVCFSSAEFDRRYEAIRGMPDSPERREKYRKLAQWLTEECPWIFESHPVAFLLKHAWVKNYRAHDFAFNRWKYLSVDPNERARRKQKFQPLSMKELRNE